MKGSRLLFRRRLLVLAATLAAVALAEVGGGGAAAKLIEAGRLRRPRRPVHQYGGHPARHLPRRRPNLVLLVTAHHGTVDNPAVAAWPARLAAPGSRARCQRRPLLMVAAHRRRDRRHPGRDGLLRCYRADHGLASGEGPSWPARPGWPNASPAKAGSIRPGPGSHTPPPPTIWALAPNKSIRATANCSATSRKAYPTWPLGAGCRGRPRTDRRAA